jgi:MYXO-CTERM domain-containing protein
MPPMKLPFLLLITAGYASAATVIQTASFEIQQPLTPGSTTFGGPDFFVTQIEPFDSSLGNLDSVSVVWEVDGQVLGTLESGGSASVSYGGTVFLGSIGIGAFGGGNGAGGGPGTPLALPFSMAPGSLASETLLDSSNTDVWALVNGTESFTASWASPFTFNIEGTVSGTATGNVSLAVVYHYTAIPEPSGTALALVSAFTLLARRRRRHG